MNILGIGFEHQYQSKYLQFSTITVLLSFDTLLIQYDRMAKEFHP